MKTKIHLKGLNGIRAFASLAIMFFHINGQLNLPYLNFMKDWNYGVTIFFCLSGFLITYLLLIEKETIHTIDIKGFYKRRILRIFPLYFFYLLIAFLQYYFFTTDVTKNYSVYLYYIFFLANIPFWLDFAAYLLNHYWSLATEEQFYMFWPFLIKNSKNILKILLIFYASFTILKIVFRLLDMKYNYSYFTSFFQVFAFDNMIIGGIGAYLFLNNYQFIQKYFFSMFAQILTLIMFGLVFLSKFHFFSVIDNQILSFFTLVLIFNTSSNIHTILKLDNRVLNFIGKISFGMYVYHPFIIHVIMPKLNIPMLESNASLYMLYQFTLLIVLTLGVSYISYEFLEKRFLKMRNFV